MRDERRLNDATLIGYSEEQAAIRRTVRDFARKEIAPGAEERDVTPRFDYGLYRRLAGEIALAGMPFREEFGGTDAHALSSSARQKESAWACRVRSR